MPTPDPLISPSAAADSLGCTVRSLYYWIAAGKGPTHVRINGRIKFRQADLDQFIATRLYHGKATA